MRILNTTFALIVTLGLFSTALAQERAPSEVTIPRGNYELKEQFFKAQSAEPAPAVLLLQGIPGAPGDVLGLGQSLTEFGIQVLTINYSGTHGSGGEWTLRNDQGDVQAALDYLHSVDVMKRFAIEPERFYLGGYSHGGGIALLYAAGHLEIRHAFSIAGNDFGEWARQTSRDSAFAESITAAFEHYEAQGWVRPAAGADRELLENLEIYDVRAKAALLAGRALSLAAGVDDKTTPLEDHALPLYRELQRKGAKQVRFAVYQVDHSFRGARGQVAKELADWILSGE